MLKINNDIKLPKDMFGQDVNLSLLAQANYVYSDRSHIGLRNTKTRSEINRTTKKVYKQKGTGGARHGSKRANLFVGGGVIFGPRPLKRLKNLSQGIKKAAKVAAFSAKAKDKQVVIVSGLSKIVKTKEVSQFIKGIAAKSFTFVLSDNAKTALRYLRNLKNTKAIFYKDINALDILKGGTLLIDDEVFTKATTTKPEVKVEVKKPSPEKVVKKTVRKAIKK